MKSALKAESFDGLMIAYDVAGSGPAALVFVHGWACNRTHWRNQVQAFSSRFMTIAIDLGGHGESGTDRSEWTRQAFADDVVAVMDQEQVDTAVLLGHSMGGGVTLYAARKLGERVKGLIGADTFTRLGEAASQTRLRRVRALEQDFSSAAQEWIDTMFTPESPADTRREVTQGMLSTPAAVGAGALRGMIESGPLLDVAKSIDVPKFAINSFGSPVDQEEARLARIEYRSVTTSGHFVMLEDPETFNRHMEEALEYML